MSKTYIVTNTKGGTGKTTTALHVLPIKAYLENKKEIVYFQLDDNNKVDISSSAVTIKNYTIKKTDAVIDKIELDVNLDNDSVNIIDIGGGNDTREVLNYIRSDQNNFGTDIEFFIPINSNLSQQKNIKDTIELIKQNFGKANITLVLNGVMDIEEYKKEFINIFGDDVYGIAPMVDYIKENCQDIKILKRDNIFQVMEYNNITLLDGYIDALEINSKIKELKKQYAMEYKEDEDMEAYYRKKRKLRFAQKVIDRVDEFNF